MTEYLDPEDALLAVEHLGLHVRDKGLLFSVIARPGASAFGEDAYATLELKAAALMTSLARNHALFDGNKRFSWYLTLAFLRINGYRVVMGEQAAFDLILDTAQGRLELEQLAAALAAHLVAEG